jgi:hypothetical protein
MLRVLIWTVLVLLAAGCGGADTPPAGEPAPQLTPGGERSIPPAESRHFDPGAITVGDRVNGLVVVERQVQRVFEDSVWAGQVLFSGEIEVRGVYQRHFDWPEPDALCFHVTDAESVQRIPDFTPDTWSSANAKVWFCFRNPEFAQELLGSGEVAQEATIVVDDYWVVREFTDTFDTARLVAVRGTPVPARVTLH